MRRLVRHAFTALSLLSLLLCVAVCVLWVRSYWVADAVGLRRDKPGPTTDIIASTNGLMMFRRWAPPANSTTLKDQGPAGWFHWHQPPENARGLVVLNRNALSVLGVVTYSDNRLRSPGNPFHGTLERVVAVPHWLLLVVTGTLPLAAFVSRQRRRRAARAAAAAGLCPQCGYDLRASPGRCPECGAAGAGG